MQISMLWSVTEREFIPILYCSCFCDNRFYHMESETNMLFRKFIKLHLMWLYWIAWGFEVAKNTRMYTNNKTEIVSKMCHFNKWIKQPNTICMKDYSLLQVNFLYVSPFRVHYRSLLMISLRPFLARPTEEVHCHSQSSTCLTFWMSRRTNTRSQTTMYGIPGRVTGGLECIITRFMTVILHEPVQKLTRTLDLCMDSLWPF